MVDSSTTARYNTQHTFSPSSRLLFSSPFRLLCFSAPSHLHDRARRRGGAPVRDVHVEVEAVLVADADALHEVELRAALPVVRRGGARFVPWGGAQRRLPPQRGRGRGGELDAEVGGHLAEERLVSLGEGGGNGGGGIGVVWTEGGCVRVVAYGRYDGVAGLFVLGTRSIGSYEPKQQEGGATPSSTAARSTRHGDKAGLFSSNGTATPMTLFFAFRTRRKLNVGGRG